MNLPGFGLTKIGLVRVYCTCNWNHSVAVQTGETVFIHVHDVIRDVERKKERKTPEAMEKWKWELPQVGFEPTTLCNV